MVCHKLSHFNARAFLLDFTWSCCRLLKTKKFSKNPSQFKWVARETRYDVSIVELLKRNLMSQVAELFHANGDYNFSKNHQDKVSLWPALREKCPNTELFLVRNFLYSNWIQRFTEIQKNTDQKKTPYWDTFHSVRGRRIFNLLAGEA